jgi:hypothetical protein
MSYETTTMLAYGIILTKDEVKKIEDHDGDPYDEIGTTGCHFEMWGNHVSGDIGYVLVVCDSQQYGGWCKEVRTEIGEYWNLALIAACEETDIQYRNPSWLLVSEYG